MKKLFFGCLLFIIHYPLSIFSQSCSSLNIQWQADLNGHTCGAFPPSTMTMMHDDLNRPYLYIANKEDGLKVYDISTVATPSLVATIPINLYDSMEVMNLCQSGNYIYLAVGNHFDTLAKQGIAIVDVTTPTSPTVTDYWQSPTGKGGAGAVAVEGNYAYLCAMGKGLIILDVSNKSSIQFVSQFIPNINYPPVANPDPKKINARGLEVKNNIVYLCCDAGGIRIINCTNKNMPIETGRFCNPAMYLPFDRPKAYNNLVVDDTLIYAAVDYAGMEVINISDTSNISLFGWWNPYNAPNANWFGCNVHANELKYEKNCKRVFISTAKSDLHVIDVSNPALPDSCNFYGGVSNNIGTWGMNMWQNQIYLSYICAVIPFGSNWSGVKILSYNSCTVGTEELSAENIFVFPNPASDKIIIKSEYELSISQIKITNMLGQSFYPPFIISENKTEADVSKLPEGLYFLKADAGGKPLTAKFVK